MAACAFGAGASRPKNLFKIFSGIALECNRDEWKLRMRRMGFMPMQAAELSNRPISLQPCGQVPCRAVCVVAALVDSQAIHCAPRLAAHPGKELVRLQKDIEQALGFNHVKLQRSL